MKKNLLLTISFILIGQFLMSQQLLPNDSIKQFVDCLSKIKQVSAKDYIFHSFEKNDIVILSERNHNELTQYDLIIEVLKDKIFKGNIYTEVGVYNSKNKIKDFLNKENLSKEEKEKELLELYRNIDYTTLWDKYNYYFLLSSIYDINQGRSQNDKIFLIPLDIVFNWDSIQCNSQYKMLMDMMEPQNNMPPVISRNLVMGQHFVRTYNEEKKQNVNKNKAIVILNTYHGYTRIPTYKKNPSEPFIYSTAQYIYKTFPTQTKGILINGYIFHPKVRLVNGGKWDAAFAISKNDDIGFDIKNTPFGKTIFDMYNFGGSAFETVNFEYIFDGIIYYKFIDDFKMVNGIPNFFNDKNYENEIYKRLAIELNVSIDEVKKLEDVKKYRALYNQVNTEKIDEILDLNKEINQWLKK